MAQRIIEWQHKNGAIMRAYCDFDGTIAVIDVTDAVLDQFASPEWREIERDWEEGLIDACQCMAAQVALIKAPLNEIDAFLDTVEIDPGFKDFVSWCERNVVSMTIVSDGVDRFIRRILSNHGLDHLDVVANRLYVEQRQYRPQYRLEAPYKWSACDAGLGVCKCAVVAAQSPYMYVGDGRSDFCVSECADMVFAKHKLAAHCVRKAIPFFPYTTFKDVQALATATLMPTPFGRSSGSVQTKLAEPRT
jgi:2-hydroxy-3-keto-5-methylthiopentenyl-1-phosphate phosphatase